MSVKTTTVVIPYNPADDEWRSLKGKTCGMCNKRPATSWWLGEGSTLDFVHGMGMPCCKRCALEEQLKYARERAADIPRLEAELAAIDQEEAK